MSVSTVNDIDFKSQLEENSSVVVKYFADWCGSCKLLAPKFKRLSNDEQYKGIKFLEVNAETCPEARRAAGVDNLPYFAIFKNGELIKGMATAKEAEIEKLLQNFINA